MTITELAIEKGIEPEKAREFLREWLEMQPVVTRIVADGSDDYTNATIPLIARPTYLGDRYEINNVPCWT